jgi:hypothetical protein
MNDRDGVDDHLNTSAHETGMRVRRIRFWVESIMASAALTLGLLTLVWRDWIEAVFGVDPDSHSGAMEWLIVVALFVVAVTLGTAAGVEWRRLAPAGHSAAS